MMKRYIVLLLATFMMLLTACGRGYQPAVTTSPPSPMPPSAPSSLTVERVSTDQVELHWFDSSNNEEGFKLYRDNKVIATLPVDTTEYRDTGLKPATTYQYTVRAYNQAGQSVPSLYTVRTLNPPITVRLDKIGVSFDHDPSITGAGDIYLYIGVADGKGDPQTCRIPSTSVIKLKDNETKEIGQQLFFSDCVGDELKIVAVAFESDAIHGVVLGLIGAALNSYLGGGSGTAVSLITTLLKSQTSAEEGCPEGVTAESPDDDFVGAIEKIWTSAEHWGIGSYKDVQSGDLRLWFTIESPTDWLVPTETPTITPIPAPTGRVTELSFSLSDEHPEYTIPIHIGSHQTLHLDWRIAKGRDSLWISFATPNGKIIGVRADGCFNDYWPQGVTCERLVRAGTIVLSPSEHDWGEGYYFFYPHIVEGYGPVAIEVSYRLED